MRIGKMRHRVALQSRAATQAGTGQPTGAWSTVATVWASIEPLQGRELVAAMAAQSELTHRVTLRYRSGITTKMRVSYGGRFFNIHAVRNSEERNQVMFLDCTEGGDGGGIG